MGMIKAWDLSRQGGDRPIWRSTLRDDLGYHRTRVNELMYGDGHLWTGSHARLQKEPVLNPDRCPRSLV